MRFKPNRLLGIALLLVLAPIASAKTWYVNGVSGSNLNNCLSTTTACKTIRRAILLAASGDTIRVAAATYKENLTIARNLTIVGAGAATTIIDGRRSSTVVTISTTVHATISNVTLRNGAGTSVAGTREGGGILNQGTLQLINSTVSGNTVLTTNCEFCSATGGGIYNSSGATATISRSTITGNKASYTLPNTPCGAWGGAASPIMER
jgi:nitrous oxidase accessory protein NosD